MIKAAERQHEESKATEGTIDFDPNAEVNLPKGTNFEINSHTAMSTPEKDAIEDGDKVPMTALTLDAHSATTTYESDTPLSDIAIQRLKEGDIETAMVLAETAGKSDDRSAGDVLHTIKGIAAECGLNALAKEAGKKAYIYGSVKEATELRDKAMAKGDYTKANEHYMVAEHNDYMNKGLTAETITQKETDKTIEIIKANMRQR